MPRKPKSQIERELGGAPSEESPPAVTEPTTPEQEHERSLPPLVQSPDGRLPTFAGVDLAVGPETIVREEPQRVVKRFEVQRDGMFMCGGHRVSLRAGKVIDDANYDVATLAQQGLVAREVP